MKIVRLADCVTKVASWNPARAGENEQFSYIDIGAVNQQSKKIDGAGLLRCVEAPSRARQLVKVDDVLVSSVRPNLNAVAKVLDDSNFATASTGFCVLRANKDVIDPNYLFNWVKTDLFINDMVKKATGASYPAVSDKIVFNSTIPLPSLAEQKRIAAILDKAAEIKAKREQAIAKLDELAQSAFKEVAMGASGFTKLKDIAAFESGGTPSKENNDYWGGDIAWISSADIVDDQIVYGRNSITELGLSSSATSLATKGTILVVTRTGVGKVAIATKDTCYSQDIVSINLKPDYETNFIAAAIRANKSNFLRQARGATIQGITKEVLGAALIPNLQIGEQRKFAKLLDAINFQRVQLIKSIAHFDRLTNSLQHQAFTTGFAA